MHLNKILEKDMDYILNKLSSREKNSLKNANLLITGCGGFLGFYLLNFFTHCAQSLQINSIIGLENYLTGDSKWLQKLEEENDILVIKKFDVIKDNLHDIDNLDQINFVIHAASVASPTFYRQYPLETIDANVTGLRKLLDFYLDNNLKGFLFFSSSEVYGDPVPEAIPTPESYRGNVTSIGPRACYDESKRMGETLCYIYANKYNMPIRIVRPFNNFGPGMSLKDKRLPADFALAILDNKDLTIHSDGSPRRTFCYIADAIQGYLKVLLYSKFDVFNIGMGSPEISVTQFAEKFLDAGSQISNYNGQICYIPSKELHYLTDNPNRRCPDITKAKEILNYNPEIDVDQGIRLFIKFLQSNRTQA